MVSFKNVVVISAAAAAVNAAPLMKTKRIAQVISDSTIKWTAACQAAGGAQKCGEVALAAFSTLLAAGDPCAHQDSADTMIDLAKTLKNNEKVIQLAQVFVQQPRNAPDSLSVLYCQKAPKNPELNGLFQCQFQGCKATVFTGNLQVGAPGTIPLGLNAPLSPAGSCASNPQGPIADGSQLVDIPGVDSTPVGSAPPTGNGGGGATPTADPDTGSNTADPDNGATSTADPEVPAATTPATPPAAPPADAKPFTLKNGQDAIALNQKFAGLNDNSPCTDGEQACVGDAFAQCVGGQFQSTQCAGGLICAALPLVNKAGTSIACTTAADRDARIAATGATSAGSAAPATNVAAVRVNNLAAKPFTLQNGKDAIAENAKFAKLNKNSACTDGQQACVANGFAQCVGGKFQTTSCGAGLVCASLPLVNKAGTSIACTTAADRDARIAATGATGGAASAPAAPAPPAKAPTPAAPAPAKATSPASPAANGAKPFTLQNGKDAKALNAKFATLNQNSACTDGEQACVGTSFAQCVGGKFQTTSCGSGLTCAALPLVNKAGTSITCTTAADRDARIAITGA